MAKRFLWSTLAVFLVAPALWADEPPIIPRTILFGNPEKTSPQLSPDGKALAYIAPDDKDVLQVWVKGDGDEKARKVTADKKRGIRSYFWTYEPDTLVYSQDTEGDENFHLLAVNVKTGVVRDLTPFQGVRAMLVDVDPSVPGEILVGLNVKNKSKFDVYRINLKNGAVDFDTENPGNIIGWTADAHSKIRAALAATPDGGHDLLLRDGPADKWRTVRHWGPEESGSPIGFSEDGKTLYITANHEANTSRLISLDIASGKETVMAEDPEYDLSGVVFHPTKRTVQAVGFLKDKIYWKALDKDMEAALPELAKLRKGQFSIASRDHADKNWIVSYSNDTGPTYYVKYNREAGPKSAEVLFSQQPKLEKVVLAPMKPISYKSRDGFTIHGYLTVPEGVPPKSLPTVLLVHGGPWGRDTWRYDGMTQWLANRGYAVLQVNFRGSTGYGKKFMNAGNKEWAGKMHDDLIDGVNWLIKEGVADQKKIAIMGGSYGGYATLVGLTFTPDVFACGVDIVGPSNIISLLKTIPPYWAPMLAMFQKRVGDLKEEEEMLKSRSPLFYVDKIKAPLLIGQGANDPRVKQAESDQIVAALRKSGKIVDYLLYTDEGHGFARPENRLHFFAHTEEFLSRYLGGRAEPIGEIKGHSGQVK
ncbi:MAG: S9 family peptidase [Planctomycetes bacterium]|nr:S9 family peptidase [Planctomycetota bacterium]